MQWPLKEGCDPIGDLDLPLLPCILSHWCHYCPALEAAEGACFWDDNAEPGDGF